MNLNMVCRKDSFPLPGLDQMVNKTVGHEPLNLVDGLLWIQSNQDVIYYYKVMPFKLKNTGATFQQMVNEIFKELNGHTMEVYVDYMLVKSLECSDHVQHLEKAFALLTKRQREDQP